MTSTISDMGCSSSTAQPAADVPAAGGDDKKEVKFGGEPPMVSDKKGVVSGNDLNREFKKADLTALNPALEKELKSFFDAMDGDKNGEVTMEEATKFWGKNFAKVNAKAMFNEVDEDGNATISWDEFLAFWRNVVASGYSEDDLVEEVEMMKEGGSWVDFNDGRTT